MAWANYFMTAVSVVAVLALYLLDFGDASAAYKDGGRLAVARRRVSRFEALRMQFASRAGEG